MPTVDIAILALIALSAILSIFKGMLREALSLGTWIGAILVTLHYSSRFATLLPIDSVQSPVARASISGILLFLGTLFAGGILKWCVGRLLINSKLSFVDRLGGVLFGVMRGAVLVSLLVLAANLVPELKSEVWWQESTLIPKFQSTASVIHAALPENIGQYFDIKPIGY